MTAEYPLDMGQMEKIQIGTQFLSEPTAQSVQSCCLPMFDLGPPLPMLPTHVAGSDPFNPSGFFTHIRNSSFVFYLTGRFKKSAVIPQNNFVVIQSYLRPLKDAPSRSLNHHRTYFVVNLRNK